jgi:hypothetical protein
VLVEDVLVEDEEPDDEPDEEELGVARLSLR